MSDFNSRIIEELRSNGGKGTGAFESSPLIILHHTGAKSGAERVTPLGCFPQSDNRFVVVASNGGSPTNPDWYYNVTSGSEVNVEFGTETFAVAVRELDGRERRDAWVDALTEAPQLAHFEEKTSRVIPVLMLTRILC